MSAGFSAVAAVFFFLFSLWLSWSGAKLIWINGLAGLLRQLASLAGLSAGKHIVS